MNYFSWYNQIFISNAFLNHDTSTIYNLIGLCIMYINFKEMYEKCGFRTSSTWHLGGVLQKQFTKSMLKHSYWQNCQCFSLWIAKASLVLYTKSAQHWIIRLNEGTNLKFDRNFAELIMMCRGYVRWRLRSSKSVFRDGQDGMNEGLLKMKKRVWTPSPYIGMGKNQHIGWARNPYTS